MDTTLAESIVYRYRDRTLRPALLGSPKRFDKAKTLFILLYFGLAAVQLVQGAAFEITLGALVITSVGLLPGYLWFKLPVKGIPVWPIMAGSSVWTYALPLVFDHPSLTLYEPRQLLYGALAISLFLVIGTCTWYFVIRRAKLLPLSCRCLPPSKNQRIWFLIFAGSIVFNILFVAGMVRLPYGVYIIVRTGVYALSLISLFILAYHYGAKTLNANARFVFLSLLLAGAYISASSLYLIKPISELLTATIAAGLGKKRPPLLIGVGFVLLVAFLHFGKGDMRARYGLGSTVQPHQIPGRLLEWYRLSIENVSSGNINLNQNYEGLSESREETSLLLRPSLIQMYMLPFTKAGGEVPLLNGSSYTPIPFLLVPRILYPNKKNSTYATSKLTIAYGLQTEEQVKTTTIGWGTLAEAQANFGFVGLVGLGVFLGAGLALMSRFAMGTPLSSLPSMLTLLLIPALINGGPTMAVLVTSYTQAAIIVLIFSFLFMKRFELSQEVVE